VLKALASVLRVLLLLALGVTLLWRALEWYAGRLAVMSHGSGRPASAPTTLVAPAPVAAPTPTPQPMPASDLPLPAPDENQPALIRVGAGAAFLVARNLYATSESLSDGYGHIYPLRFPGALTSGAVIVHDRAGSGIALFSTETDYLPSVTPMPLASAARLRPGERVRALQPGYSRFTGAARPVPGIFVGLRLEQRLVLFDIRLPGAMVPGAPLLDDADHVVGIVVRRREQQEDRFVAADHISELVRKAQLTR
jgi:hypothetical protein